MKIICMLVLTLLAATFARAADEPILKSDHKEAIEQALVKVERNWYEATKNRDKAALSALCSEDFQYTDEDGKPTDRTHYIGEIMTNVKISAYTMSAVSARSYGDTGIVQGRWDGTVEVDGHNAELKLQFTDTFVRRDNRWWAVASQATRIGDDRAAN